MQKNVKERGPQKYLCKECGCNFIEGRQKDKWKNKSKESDVYNVIWDREYVNTQGSKNVWIVYRWINEATQKLPDYKIKNDIKEIEFA